MTGGDGGDVIQWCHVQCQCNASLPYVYQSEGCQLHLLVLPTPTLAMGKGKVAKGKVTKPANKGMYVKGNAHNTKTKAMHGTAHAMKHVKKTSGHDCAQW